MEGNFRNGRRKRQRGLGEFDSDDSSDEDESRRPKIEKKRRIDGDKLHEFGKLRLYACLGFPPVSRHHQGKILRPRRSFRYT